MTETAIFEPGGYRYVRGPFQYSGGVAAEDGFAIERVRFQTPVPEGLLSCIEAYLDGIGRPYTRSQPADSFWSRFRNRDLSILTASMSERWSAGVFSRMTKTRLPVPTFARKCQSLDQFSHSAIPYPLMPVQRPVS